MLGQEMDYSQGLPTPMGQLDLGITDTLKKVILPIALVAIAVVAIASFSVSSSDSGLAGLLGGGKKKRKVSKKAQKFISKKISILTHEKPGRSQKQAIRIAFEMAREKGFHVPSTPKG